jgi:hypothetical protein
MRAGQVFTDGDLTNILAAVALAAGAASSGHDSPHATAYRRGFADAIGAVAVAVGIPPGTIGERLAPFEGLGRPELCGDAGPRGWGKVARGQL